MKNPAMVEPAVAAVLIDDEWSVQAQDGSRIGPVSREQLDMMVRVGQIAPYDELHRNGQYLCRAREMYSKLRMSLPGPIRYVLCGPDLPPYQCVPRSAQTNFRRWLVMGGAILLGFFLSAAAVGLNGIGMFGFPPALPFGMVLFLIGLFCLGAALFEWHWFFNSRRARGVRKWLGDRGARTFYIVLALGLLGFSYAAFAKDAAMGAVAMALTKPLASREEMNQAIYRSAKLPEGTVVVKPIRQLKPSRGQHFDRIALSNAGDEALLGGQDRSLHLWSTGAAATTKLWNRDKVEFLSRSLVARSADGTCVAIVLCEFDPARRKLTFRIHDVDQPFQPTMLEVEDAPSSPKERRGQIKFAAVSGDGTRVGLYSDDQLFQLWNLEDGTIATSFQLDSMTNAIALSNDGTQMLSGSAQGPVRLWDLESASELDLMHTGKTVRHLQFSPCGTRVAAVAVQMHRNTIHVWTLADGSLTPEHAFKGLFGHVRLAFSNDGQYLVDGGSGDIIRLRNLQSGKEAAWFVGQHAIKDVALSPDGTHLIASSQSGQCCLWTLPLALLEPSDPQIARDEPKVPATEQELGGE